MFSRSVNKIVRKNREAKAVHIVVKSPQRCPDINTSTEEHLSGRIEGKSVVNDKFVKIIDQGKIICHFKGGP